MALNQREEANDWVARRGFLHRASSVLESHGELIFVTVLVGVENAPFNQCHHGGHEPEQRKTADSEACISNERKLTVQNDG